MSNPIVKKWADRAWNEQLPVDDAIEGAVLEALADVVRDRDELLAALRDLLEYHHGTCEDCSADGPGERHAPLYALIRRIETGE